MPPRRDEIEACYRARRAQQEEERLSAVARFREKVQQGKERTKLVGDWLELALRGGSDAR
jgi:hypothetical protein